MQHPIPVESSLKYQFPHSKKSFNIILNSDRENIEEEMTLGHGDVDIGLNGNIPTVNFADHGIQKRVEDSLHELDESLQSDYEEVCFQEELLWIQRSSFDWLCLGDCNTCFHHTKALKKRNRNRMTQLKSANDIRGFGQALP
ncbi:hypothetical protein K1719_007279 [Acacia pycnantha]|nr:hypothetical protein K1719_007279 [Acacia pycnantha]